VNNALMNRDLMMLRIMISMMILFYGVKKKLMMRVNLYGARLLQRMIMVSGVM